MTRDFELHIYFEHEPLTGRLVDALLDDLAVDGLHLGGPTAAAYPAFAGISGTGAPSDNASAEDLEMLLRSKQPPVGAGYGVLPFSISIPELHDAQAFLTFSRPDGATGLDGVSLIVDGAAFARHQPAALDAAFRWFASLCSRLAAVYGWGDWETATFLVAAPSRRDIRAGVLPRLLRFNAIGPSLFGAVDLAAAEATAPRFRRLVNGVVLFEAGRDLPTAGLGEVQTDG